MLIFTVFCSIPYSWALWIHILTSPRISPHLKALPAEHKDDRDFCMMEKN